MIRKPWVTRCLLVAALAATAAGGARAAAARSGEIAATSIGPRLGFGLGPDQVVLGGQVTLGAFHPDWTFSPILEIGFGDHQTVVTLDFDAYYHLYLSDSDWRPYVGGGLSLDNFNFDREPPFPHESETNAGLNFVVGTSIPTGSSPPMFVELRLGVGDIPNLRAMFGLNFPLRK